MWLNFCSTICMRHSGVFVSHMPVRTILLFWYFINASFLRNVTSVPPSHTTGIENSGLVISLKTFAFFSCGVITGMISYTLAIDCMFVLMAHWTSIGWFYIVFPGKVGGAKLLVAAVPGYVISCCFNIRYANYFCCIWGCVLHVIFDTQGKITKCFI